MENSLFKDPRVEVPDNDRQVIIMITIYDWFCARYDTETETWREDRFKKLVWSRNYVHLWMEMQEDFKVKRDNINK